MEKFSITAFYWGNKQNLEAYVEHCSNYTDDVVIINIDLLNSFESFGIANIINVPFDYLFHNGHDDILNLANQHTKYDWVYYLAIGKRIVSLDMSIMDRNPNAKCFFDKELNNSIDKWIKFYNKNYTHWTKKVHEVINVFPDVEHMVCEEIILEWKRRDDGNAVDGQYICNEEEKKIYENFRQFTRLKWVSLDLIHRHPAIDFAIQQYAKHKFVYEMNKENLLEYLSSNYFKFGM